MGYHNVGGQDLSLGKFAMSGLAALLLWLGPAKLACGNLICIREQSYSS
jgi:hypothetical protein